MNIIQKNPTLVISSFSVIDIIFHFYDAFTGNHTSIFTLKTNCMELIKSQGQYERRFYTRKVLYWKEL